MAGVSDSPARQAPANALRDNGALVNPSFVPQIPGTWRWLEPGDEKLAQALGYEDQVDVTGAREQGLFTDTVDGRFPGVFWRPHSTFWNPARAPNTPGHFEYFGNTSRDLAWTNFGSSEEYQMQNEARPTAAHIQHLRQQFFAQRGDYGPTREIDIVYVPDDPEYSPPPSREPSPAPTGNETKPPKPDDTNGIDSITSLTHDPSNGGKNDQTGIAEHLRYRTIIPQKAIQQVTVDISPAAKDRPELHKLWCPNQKGNWVKWAPRDIATVNWSDSQHLKRLNGWRDQALSRAGFGFKRDGPRDDYTPNQKRWLFDNHIAPRKGTPPGVHNLPDVRKEFNKNFDAERTQAGLSAVCARLAKMWRENGGKLTAGPQRGDAQRQRRLERVRQQHQQSGIGEQAPTNRKDTTTTADTHADTDESDMQPRDETTNVRDETQASDVEPIGADGDENAEGEDEDHE